jgi:hypothetical protein
VKPAGVIFDEDKKPEPEQPKPKSVCENIMSKISDLAPKPLIALDHKGQPLDDYTVCPCYKKCKCKNFWAYLFSVFIIAVIITQLVGLLKKMGSIISISTNKSYYEDWTENNATYCSKFPGNIKASYNCNKTTKYDMDEKKAFTLDHMNSQADILEDPLIKMAAPFDI